MQVKKFKDDMGEVYTYRYNEYVKIFTLQKKDTFHICAWKNWDEIISWCSSDGFKEIKIDKQTEVDFLDSIQKNFQE